MSQDRKIDWRAFLNRLVFCFGCGRFGLPRRGKSIPSGWKLMYQPHPDGRPGLHICSEDCWEAVRLAMRQGPITEPLMMPDPEAMMFPADVRQAMEKEIEEGLNDEGSRGRHSEEELAGDSHQESSDEELGRDG